MKIIFALILFMTAIFWHCDKNVSGNVSEEKNAFTTVYLPDGRPAAMAKVAVCPANNIPGDTASGGSSTVLYATETDAQGQYQITSLTRAYYNIIINKDSLAAFQDSVYIDGTNGQIKDDTLHPSGGFFGYVKIQPNHDPRTVVAQLVGTYSYSNVTQEGSLRFDGLAGGDYTLRLVSTLPEYTPTFFRIKVQSGKMDTLQDSLELIYTGIPAVVGLTANYDTLNGIVRLSWSRTDYRDILEYLIFRDDYNNVTFSQTPYATSLDTFFNDTIYKAGVNWDVDTIAHYKYRVCIRNNSFVSGITYRFAQAVAMSPHQSLRLSLIDTLVSTMFLSCTLTVTPGVWFKGVRALEWDFGATGTFKSLSDVKTTITFDSLFAPKVVVLRLTDTLGRTGMDTIIIVNYMRFSQVSTDLVSDSAAMAITCYNSDSSEIWLLGSCRQSSGGYLYLSNPRLYKSTNALNWQKVSNDLPFKSYSSMVYFNRSLIVAEDTIGLWSSTDGVVWNKADCNITFDALSHLIIGQYKSSLYLIQTLNNDAVCDYDFKKIIFASTDANHWSVFIDTQKVTDYQCSTAYGPLVTTDSCLYIYYSFYGSSWGYVTKIYENGTTENKMISSGNDAQPPLLIYWPLFYATKILIGMDPVSNIHPPGLYFSNDGVLFNNLGTKETPVPVNHYSWESLFVFNNRLFWITGTGIWRN